MPTPLLALEFHFGGEPGLPIGLCRVHQDVRVHVRVAGSFAEQRALLSRDHLREHPDEPGLAEAERWAKDTGWSPGPSAA